MEKLTSLSKNYSRWKPLIDYIDRIIAFVDSNFPLCIENCKALLESISKEICKEKKQPLDGGESVNKLLSLAFGCLGYPRDNPIRQISQSIANIGQQIGNLRNELGIVSHGRTMEELLSRNDKISAYTREFLISSIDLVASFLIEAFETNNPLVHASVEINFDNETDFNEYWDGLYGIFQMGQYNFGASEILFKCDPESYKLALAEYKQSLDETNN